MGSNGLTSARHDIFCKPTGIKYPESYDNSLPEEVTYSGKLNLTDKVKGVDLNAGKLVLSPTRTYAPVVKKILETLRPEIHGMVHCSGGGQTKILHFIDNLLVVKDNLFPLPPLFELIQEQSGTPWKEMYQVFNMGHRFEIYTSEKNAETIISISKEFDLDARIIGHCEASANKKLTISSEFGEFEY
jgi:phosphoribosylformylglycinamidine cyclo-ligase